jgi:ribosomal RNA-processing protein 8
VQYHEGYREQAKGWEVNPLHNIISWIRSSHPSAVVVDMGCGDAQLAQSVPNTVHSYDLVSKSPLVIACNNAHLPLEDASVDIVVCCLSLMGTNIGDFLKEAQRILKPRGIVKIAEVRSRFEGEEDGLKKFIRVIKLSGFEITQKDFLSKMFLMLEGVKSNHKVPLFNDTYSAKACVYKKR